MYYNKNTPRPHIGDWAADIYADPNGRFDPNAWCGVMTDDEIHTARAAYYGDVSFIDNQIGRFIMWITRYQPELLNNTWFIFTADHGDMLGDHYLWRKTYAYEGSAHIPLIITPPLKAQYKPKRKFANEPVELRDIMPTILDIAGINIPKTVDGISLLKLTDKPDNTNSNTQHWRKYIHGEHCHSYSEKQAMQYITDGKYKFVWLHRIGIEQFFDLQKDPGETHNLINDPSYKSKIELFRGYLITELKQRGWLKNDKLTELPDPLISPYKDKRRT